MGRQRFTPRPSRGSRWDALPTTVTPPVVTWVPSFEQTRAKWAYTARRGAISFPLGHGSNPWSPAVNFRSHRTTSRTYTFRSRTWMAVPVHPNVGTQPLPPLFTRQSGGKYVVSRRSQTWQPVPAPIPHTAPMWPPLYLQSRVKPFLPLRRGKVITPVPTQSIAGPAPLVPRFTSLRGHRLMPVARGRNTSVIVTSVHPVPPVPVAPTQGGGYVSMSFSKRLWHAKHRAVKSGYDKSALWRVA